MTFMPIPGLRFPIFWPLHVTETHVSLSVMIFSLLSRVKKQMTVFRAIKFENQAIHWCLEIKQSYHLCSVCGKPV